jgi:hypothetical protein
MRKEEQAVLNDLSENFKCDHCQGFKPAPMITFEDVSPPRGIGGRYCKNCARGLLGKQILSQMPDIEAARRSHDLGSLAQRHYRELQDYANRAAAAVIDGAPLEDPRVPGFDREAMMQKCRAVVNRPESARAQANPDVVHVGGGRLLPDAAKVDRREGLLKQD